MVATQTSEPTEPESFFLQLFGGRAHIEGNVSRAFAMCFRESRPFADAVLDLLHRACRIPPHKRDREWHCRTEVTFKKGRPDIEIHSPTGTFFRLENKVGAPLTRNQLVRYRLTGKRQVLIALTKRPPDVGRRWMVRKGVFSIRWQDIHRAVAAAKGKGRDSYLRDSFCLYLEELGMAHREDIKTADLDRLNELFQAIAGNAKRRSVAPRNAFDVAESCLHLLREVVGNAREELPGLEAWSRRGPFYSKDLWDDLYYHHLGFYFHRKRHAEMLGAGFTFVEGEDRTRWEVWRIQKNQAFEKVKSERVERIVGRTGALDRGKMLRSFVTAARAWGFRG
jgi:hypothetical protein